MPDLHEILVARAKRASSPADQVVSTLRTLGAWLVAASGQHAHELRKAGTDAWLRRLADQIERHTAETETRRETLNEE